MFNNSSNIIIQGGTFINIVGNIDSASPSLEEMGVNISQNSAVHKRGGSNPHFCASHGQGLTTNQSSYRNLSQETDALEFCKLLVDPAPGSHSAENFGTSVYTSGQVPEYSPYLMPTPSITSEVNSWGIMSIPSSVESVGASRRNAKPNDDSHDHLHSQCLAISQIHNTEYTHPRSGFGNVIQLVLSVIILSLALQHRLLATKLGHPHTHSQHLLPLFRSPN